MQNTGHLPTHAQPLLTKSYAGAVVLAPHLYGPGNTYPLTSASEDFTTPAGLWPLLDRAFGYLATVVRTLARPVLQPTLL
jgi:hypothetical protein